jgi:hypothetical protein
MLPAQQAPDAAAAAADTAVILATASYDHTIRFWEGGPPSLSPALWLPLAYAFSYSL